MRRHTTNAQSERGGSQRPAQDPEQLLAEACRRNATEVVRILIENVRVDPLRLPGGRTALHIAASVGALETFDYLATRIDLGALDSRGQTAAHAAASAMPGHRVHPGGGAPILQRYREARLGSDLLAHRDHDGLTPLMISRRWGYEQAEVVLTGQPLQQRLSPTFRIPLPPSAPGGGMAPR